MGPLVSMSLEEMERSDLTGTIVAMIVVLDCGVVLFLTSVERCRAYTFTLAMIHHMVEKFYDFHKYIYILFTGNIVNLSVYFTLHTDPRAEVPEFTISCRTYGGPATFVNWIVRTQIDNETSQLILNSSHYTVYDNRFRVKGRKPGDYSCLITNIQSTVRNDTTVMGMFKITVMQQRDKNNIIPIYAWIQLFYSCRRACQSGDSHL